MRRYSRGFIDARAHSPKGSSLPTTAAKDQWQVGPALSRYTHTYTHAHTPIHTRTHTRARAHTHTHTKRSRYAHLPPFCTRLASPHLPLPLPPLARALSTLMPTLDVPLTRYAFTRARACARTQQIARKHVTAKYRELGGHAVEAAPSPRRRC